MAERAWHGTKRRAVRWRPGSHMAMYDQQTYFHGVIDFLNAVDDGS